MCKSKKIALVTALMLILVGICVMTIGGVMMGFDLEKLDTATYVEREDSVEDPFTELKIDALAADIRILPATDGTCKVVSRLNEKISYELLVADGTLCIKCTDDRSWYERIGFGLGKERITVYLPEGDYGNFTVNVKSGDVSISELLCGELYMDTASGDVSVVDTKVTKEVGITVSSGDITLKDMMADALIVKTASGDIEVADAKAAGQVKFTASSGDIEMEDLLFDSLVAKTASGDIEFARIDGRELELKTASGDVEGSLLSGKNFDADTSTGDVRVPPSDPTAGICKVRTASGDIDIEVIS